VNITLCSSCQLGSTGFKDVLQAAITAAGLTAQVQLVECMSGCTRPSTLAFRDTGKTAYLFGDLTEADLPGLLTFTAAYAASDDGRFADARPLGALRFKALARIPG